MSKYITSISNRCNSIYEISNIVTKREQYFLINNLYEIINHINDRYLLKESKVIIIKIINLTNNEQLTIEIVFDSVNYGLFIKLTNPNKNLVYNTDSNNSYNTTNLKNLFPITIDKLKKYNLVKSYFN